MFISAVWSQEVTGGVTKFAAGANHSVAIRSDSTLWAWGYNYYGQLGDGSTEKRAAPVQVGLTRNWSGVAAGDAHTVGLKADGTLWGWGLNQYGQLGNGTTTFSEATPVRVSTATDWAAVAAGACHTVALKANGTLWAWGYNRYGQLGDGTTMDKSSPVQVGADTGWKAVAAGFQHTVALKTDGTLWAWGYNQYGQLGDGTTDNKTRPVQVGADTRWKAVTAVLDRTFALKTDGTLWAWGNNEYGRLGDGTTVNRTSPVQVGTASDWVAVASGDYQGVGIKSDGTLWAFAQGWSPTTPEQVGTDNDWTAVAAGGWHNLAMKSDGTLWAWGSNGYDQLGDGTTIYKTVPVQVGSDNDWSDVDTGWSYTIALKANHTLWAWGYPDNASPVQVGADSDWSAVVAGFWYNLAMKSDGTLWGWGHNSFGQLGIGTATYSELTPVQVGTDIDWAAVAASSSHSLALKSDGTLYAWGDNNRGQLGDGTTENRTSPVQVGTAGEWAAVATGYEHTLGIKKGGSLWAWGSNFRWQLGYDYRFYDHSEIPLQVGTATDWAAVTAGADRSFALKSDGTLWTWGNFIVYLAQVGTAADWKKVVAGHAYNAALKTDGTLWTWGGNEFGQLGDGTTVNRTTPVQVGNATGWLTVAPCAEHSAAVKSDGTLWTWGKNEYGQLGLGEVAVVLRLLPVQVLVPQPNPVPVLQVPDTMIVAAQDQQGVKVAFVATAQDCAGNPLVVACTPPSDSVFPLGATTVVCSATDAEGQSVTASFLVLVTLDPERAAADLIIASEGGQISTPDGSVSLIIPKGALTQDTLLSVAETGTSFKLTSDRGQGTAIYGIVIEPKGTTFNPPLQVVFRWADANNDGIVDGTSIKEQNLMITKDNVVIAERCRTCPTCDMVNNTFTVEVQSLSEFCLSFIDTEGPVASNLEVTPAPLPLHTPATLMAWIDDSTTGSTPIAGAEFSLDGIQWVAMDAADGAFDEVSEAVVGTVPGFTQPGVYRIQVRGWDRMLNVLGPVESVFLPVYDPTGGFVTGTGWINSPAGAYTTDPNLASKAIFGFVAKYLKGANVPTGNTEFQFKAGNLNFKSRAYQWLVVAGAKAQYKGWGTINGQGNYAFMLTAIDGQVNGGGGADRFRIRIWDDAGGAKIYDNQHGTDDSAGLTKDGTLLQGGSIVIHKP